ncbi:hypothetical protein PIB30_013772 [Stylosanthes scabra]|uniref:Uncharacterized protein n=1 Tax=Stylosanthes scabra TaxID=79078 RepID=A0ABU6Q761_9FABA|nr:hypothetical protein [Stylosanthes scabra]
MDEDLCGDSGTGSGSFPLGSPPLPQRDFAPHPCSHGENSPPSGPHFSFGAFPAGIPAAWGILTPLNLTTPSQPFRLPKHDTHNLTTPTQTYTSTPTKRKKGKRGRRGWLRRHPFSPPLPSPVRGREERESEKERESFDELRGRSPSSLLRRASTVAREERGRRCCCEREQREIRVERESTARTTPPPPISSSPLTPEPSAGKDVVLQGLGTAAPSRSSAAIVPLSPTQPSSFRRTCLAPTHRHLLPLLLVELAYGGTRICREREISQHPTRTSCFLTEQRRLVANAGCSHVAFSIVIFNYA